MHVHVSVNTVVDLDMCVHIHIHIIYSSTQSFSFSDPIYHVLPFQETLQNCFFSKYSLPLQASQ